MPSMCESQGSEKIGWGGGRNEGREEKEKGRRRQETRKGKILVLWIEGRGSQEVHGVHN